MGYVNWLFLKTLMQLDEGKLHPDLRFKIAYQILKSSLLNSFM